MSENVTEEKKTRLRSASNSTLPQTSAIPDRETFQSMNMLLKEAIKLKVKVSEMEERLEEIKLEAAAVCGAYDLKGFRHGLGGFDYRGYNTRKTLDKQALVERMSAYGCPTSLIEECYRPGESFLDARFVVFDLD